LDLNFLESIKDFFIIKRSIQNNFWSLCWQWFWLVCLSPYWWTRFSQISRSCGYYL